MEVRILIADDHSAVRRGVKHILGSFFPSLVFGESINANDTMQKIQERNWDLLILDIEVPGRNGFDVLKQIRTEAIKTPVLVFSFYPEDQIALRVLKAGASGYVRKDCADEDLVDAINLILSGKKYVSSQVAQQLVEHVQQPEDPLHLLSDREYQTLMMIASGKTVSDISQELSLSISTISTYRSRILQKTGMRTNAELMSYVVRRNLLNQKAG